MALRISTKAFMIYRLSLLTLFVFSLFIAWIVYLADSGQEMILFTLAKSTPYGDKMGHFILFGFFAFILTIVFRLRGFRTGPVFIPYGSLLIFVLVVLEEASQRWFPGRTCDITDLAADLCGILFFSFLAFSAPIKNLIKRPPSDSNPDPLSS